MPVENRDATTMALGRRNNTSLLIENMSEYPLEEELQILTSGSLVAKP